MPQGNIVFAPMLLDEDVCTMDIVGTAIIIAACVLLVAFGDTCTPTYRYLFSR